MQTSIRRRHRDRVVRRYDKDRTRPFYSPSIGARIGLTPLLHLSLVFTAALGTTRTELTRPIRLLVHALV